MENNLEVYINAIKAVVNQYQYESYDGPEHLEEDLFEVSTYISQLHNILESEEKVKELFNDYKLDLGMDALYFLDLVFEDEKQQPLKTQK